MTKYLLITFLSLAILVHSCSGCEKSLDPADYPGDLTDTIYTSPPRVLNNCIGYDTLDINTAPQFPGWVRKNVSLPAGVIGVLPYFLDSLRAVLAYKSNIFKTEDSGATWKEVFSAPEFRLGGIAFSSASTGVAWAERTNSNGQKWILVSTHDGGNTWSATPTGTFNLGSIYYTTMFGTDTLFVHGQETSGAWECYKSTDAGLTWSPTFRHLGINNIRSLSYLNQDTIYAINGSNFLFRTTNGGVQWDSILILSGIFADELYFVDSNIGYITGFGGVSRTMDGGFTWTTVSLRPTSFYMAISKNETIFYQKIKNCVDESFQAFVTTDDFGQSWSVGPQVFYKEDEEYGWYAFQRGRGNVFSGIFGSDISTEVFSWVKQP